MARSVRIKVYDSRIYSLNAPGGDLHQWMNKLQNETVVRAKELVPKRSGALMASIHGSTSGNALGSYSHVYASTHYARYVHNGTRTPITPRVANYLRWEGYGAFGGRIWRRPWVHGQAAQPFLRDALTDVFHRNRVI